MTHYGEGKKNLIPMATPHECDYNPAVSDHQNTIWRWNVDARCKGVYIFVCVGTCEHICVLVCENICERDDLTLAHRM